MKNTMLTMRRSNIIKILNTLYNAGPLSRTNISNHTNISTSAVTSITKELKDKKLIKEYSSIKDNSLGRPSKPLNINDKKWYVLGVNISGEEEIKLSVFNLFLEKKHDVNIYLKSLKPDFVVEEILKAYKKISLNMNKNDKIIGLGVSVSGVINNDNKSVQYSETLGWNNVNLKSLLEENLSIPVIIERDVNALSTFEFMAADDSNELDPFSVVMLGKGIGLGMIINGSIYSGHLAGGEISHIANIDSDNKISCKCGQVGCISTVLIKSYLMERIKKTLDNINFDLVNINESVSINEIEEPLVFFDSLNLEIDKYDVYKDYIEAISKLLKIITEIYSPKKMIISSSYVIPDKLKGSIQKEYINKVFLPDEFINDVEFKNHTKSDWAKSSASTVVYNLLNNIYIWDYLDKLFH
ncbi:MAG: ROK family transcriptional regulator [Halanaerobiales bacterium]